MKALLTEKGVHQFKREVRVHKYITWSYVALISLGFFLLNLALYTFLVWAAWQVVVVNHFDGASLTTAESIILGFVVIIITRRYYLSEEKIKGYFLLWRVKSVKEIAMRHTIGLRPSREELLQALRDLRS